MHVHEAIKKRKSIRAFLDKEVPLELVGRILEHAKQTPSSTNMQPWSVCVVAGEAKKKLDQALLGAFDAGVQPSPDYLYYPKEWAEPYKGRRITIGAQMYDILGIKREDKAARIKQWRANFEAFGAPVVLYFFMDKILKGGSWLDYGMFLQSVMLLCVEEGLGSCSMGSLAEYPDIVRKELGVESEKILLCGMAIGYPDTRAPINSLETQREPWSAFTTVYM
ncbi:nitroreductase family protein [Sulfurospirillum sp. T05]|uniref:Nitroreductase family protein n=1 Tax=Sulfurospirillum tamanense TaxID=2813362 RepID=A0ABS2WRA9_9BACT|nr:nitroreductase family protein [Sulfurospirillum tamanensis]MBN2963759.1 nitroreductase family protein [Sulfurospirillum tamanensis]